MTTISNRAEDILASLAEEGYHMVTPESLVVVAELVQIGAVVISAGLDGELYADVPTVDLSTVASLTA